MLVMRNCKYVSLTRDLFTEAILFSLFFLECLDLSFRQSCVFCRGRKKERGGVMEESDETSVRPGMVGEAAAGSTNFNCIFKTHNLGGVVDSFLCQESQGYPSHSFWHRNLGKL